METIVAVVVVAVLAIPAGTAFAVYRVSRLSAEVAALRRKMEGLERRAAQAPTPRTGEAGGRPAAPPARDRGLGSDPDPDPADGPGPRDPGPIERRPTPVSTETHAGAVPSYRREAAREEAASDRPAEPGADAGRGDGSRTEGPRPGGASEEKEWTTDARPTEPRPEQATGDLDLETVIGRTWLLRVGLGVLAIALALFARTIAPALPPAAKVALAYAGSMAFVGAGRFFESRLERFARPVMAAGLSFGFFVAFAAHFVPAMRAVSMPVSIVWMALSMVAILVAAERWRSETTAILAIVLGHVSAQVTAGAADVYSLVLIGALALTAIALLIRHRWVTVGLVGVVVSYGAHLLWLLVDRELPTGNRGFWLSVAFLTSYYVIFLVADLIWWHRHRDTEPAAPRPVGLADLSHIRALGPANLVLYASLTTFVFFASGALVESIEWYYLTLGALQGVFAWLYRGVNHRDYVYYPLFGTVLWTLGMFAALDALVLNLVLAAQALILLLAAQRTGLRVFYLLAQGAMAVALVHYLAYPPPTIATLPIFLGGVGVAAVYLAKAALEERWFGEQALLPPLHAIAGSLVLAREAFAYFGVLGGLALFFAVALPLLLLVAAFTSRSSLVVAVTTLAALAPAVVRRTMADAASGTSVGAAPIAGAGAPAAEGAASLGLQATLPAWILAATTVLTALALLRVVERRFPHVPANGPAWQSQLIAVVAGACGFVAWMGPWDMAGGVAMLLLWMAVPLMLLAYQSVAEAEHHRFETDAIPEPPEDRLQTHRAVSLCVGVGAAWLVLAYTEALTSGELAPVLWTAVWTVVLTGAAVGLHRVSLVACAYTVLVAGYSVFLIFTEGALAGIGMGAATHPGLASVWAGLILVVVVVGSGVAFDRLLHAHRASGSREPAAALALSVVPYLMAIWLAGLYAGAHLPPGWSFVAPALLALALLVASERLGAPGALSGALLGVSLWHLLFLVAGPRSPATSEALAPLLLFATLTLVLERVGGARLARSRDADLRQPISIALVLMATGSAMVAVYYARAIGPTWATAGFSVLGGTMMAAGFALRSSLHRRVALGVLGVCLVRVFAVDTVGLSDAARIGAFFMLGIVLVGIAALYARYSEEMRRWL